MPRAGPLPAIAVEHQCGLDVLFLRWSGWAREHGRDKENQQFVYGISSYSSVAFNLDGFTIRQAGQWSLEVAQKSFNPRRIRLFKITSLKNR